MIQLKISDNSCIGAARRAAMALINACDYTEAEAGTLAIIVNELASNLVKYANTSGQLVLRLLSPTVTNSGIEIVAIDKGPGISNLAQCLRDGYSTSGTPGTGLGAIKRLSHSFNVYSLPGQGTVLQVHYWPKNVVPKPDSLFDIGSICVPKSGEKVSGDAWASQQIEQQLLILVADGLGHGPEAAVASQLACQIFMQKGHLSLTQQIMAIHTALRPTRGAAIAIAAIDNRQQCVQFAGLGNISASIGSAEKNHHLVSHDGTAGLSQTHIQEYTYPWYQDARLIMHSDGLATRWDLNRYPGLTARPSTLVASILYRDFTRGYDDTTVVVAQAKSPFR